MKASVSFLANDGIANPDVIAAGVLVAFDAHGVTLAASVDVVERADPRERPLGVRMIGKVLP